MARTSGRGDSRIELLIHDDGVGGADPFDGSGLTGVKDRVESFGATRDRVAGRSWHHAARGPPHVAPSSHRGFRARE